MEGGSLEPPELPLDSPLWLCLGYYGVVVANDWCIRLVTRALSIQIFRVNNVTFIFMYEGMGMRGQDNFHQTAVSWLTAMNTSQYMHLNFVLLSVIIQFATCLQIEKHTGSGQKFGCTKIHKLTCALFKTRSLILYLNLTFFLPRCFNSSPASLSC